ncbi:MAG: valine--tRNA ligase [Nitrospira sp.]|nr:valine--tRNA ligase [Nitrospira sp.]MBP6606486.1 valine--tRNA ligase [Nitrospira sp.]HQY57790.1 valine--tRNA ligase [Nitrospira sp.]
MSTPQLDKTYSPHAVEDRWYQRWIDAGLFHADPAHSGQPYSMVIPPPNVTGSLHVGHALNNTLQDILIRWRRMQGYNVLWMPGTDHAGIATQNVVERQLQTEGTTREALGREEFLKRVWQWKEKSGGTIISQLKRLGASCDWERERFTMDEGLSEAVREVFVRLHADGLLYRGERLINWCPRCLTALSDIEVEHEEITGKLYTIRYALVDDPTQVLFVATTRPETLFGDTAVAVHPEDERYRHLIGKQIQLPLTTRAIPIVGDSILVDREFGTGAVKITPAHDFNDFEAGERHGLRRIKILDIHANLRLEGSLAEAGVAQAVEGLPVAKARPKIEQLLTDQGLLEKSEPHKMALGKCYRCKTVVEPLLSDQWFVKIKPLAEPAIQAVEDGRVRIIPEAWKNNYLGWMRDIKDWCVSRQIWWGHQIPAWYCETCYGSPFLRRSSDGAPLIPSDAAVIVAKTTPTTCPKGHSGALVQDPDVLDTWFSSALWPFSTLGWPKQTPELKTFYPTSTLVTGLDILFFWVARMIMMGLKFMGEVPFRDVYIHALVRDAEGQKMSKSKGNVIDPLHVMEQFGTDALRFTMAAMASPGRDVKLAEERIEGYRNFTNKIWNAARFLLMHLDGERVEVPPAQRSFPDRWILSRLNATIGTVTQELEQYRFDRASSAVYQFIWHEYCDKYIEMIKPALKDQASEQAKTTRQTLAETFETMMRLLHPFMPFISEEIWQTLPHEGASIVRQPYPTVRADWASQEAEQEFALLEECRALMNQERAILNYPAGKRLPFKVHGKTDQAAATFQKHRELIEYMENVEDLFVGSTSDVTAPHLLTLTSGSAEVGTSMEGADLQKAKDNVLKQIALLQKEVARTQQKLGNPDFVAKAPPDVLTDHHDRLARESRMIQLFEQALHQIISEQKQNQGA